MKTNNLHIGLDVHGVINQYPYIFKQFSLILRENGCRVSIITGQEWEKVGPEVDKLGIFYTDHFSIVDYHRNLGTKMWQSDKGTWWMEDTDWVRSKGDYIFREKVDIHFDDSWEYANYVPNFCTFVLVPKENFRLFGWESSLFPIWQI